MYPVLFLALLATIATWSVTALGAATVIFFKSPNARLMNLMLGFASGVMIAASFWSLLQPAIARAEMRQGLPAWLIATTGFLSGAAFMWLSDQAVSHARIRIGSMQAAKNPVSADPASNPCRNYRNNDKHHRKTFTPSAIQACSASNCAIQPQDTANERFSRILMLILSITLHNIPEGLAVGVAFGVLQDGYSPESLMGAVTIAVGIALQNFPEGAAVSIPLRREGFSRKKSFFYGQASGIVEPIAGLCGALLVVYVEAILPFALSFAAGAMILVAVHELIPECQKNQKNQPYAATMGIVLGFAVMMLLDVMLG